MAEGWGAFLEVAEGVGLMDAACPGGADGQLRETTAPAQPVNSHTLHAAKRRHDRMAAVPHGIVTPRGIPHRYKDRYL